MAARRSDDGGATDCVAPWHARVASIGAAGNNPLTMDVRRRNAGAFDRLRDGAVADDPKREHRQPTRCRHATNRRSRHAVSSEGVVAGNR